MAEQFGILSSLSQGNTALALDIEGGSTNNGAKAVLWTWHGGNSQKWFREPAEEGYFYLRNVQSGKVLEVGGTSQEDGAQINQWEQHPAGIDGQKWRMERAPHAAPKEYYLVNKATGKVIDIAENSHQPGTPIVQYSRKGGTDENQWWVMRQLRG